MNPAALGNSSMRSLASSPRRSFMYVMARRQPACCNFCAMAHAMLRLLASPKITAVFCPSLILESSVVSYQFSVKRQIRLLFGVACCAFAWPVFSCRSHTESNAMEGFLDFFHGIAKHDGPAVRAAHRAIGFCKRGEQPFHFRLVERHVDFDRRMARGRRRNFCLQRFDGNGCVFALDAVENFRQKFFR